MRVRAIASTGCWVLLALLPVGCGRDVTLVDHLAGAEVATMAERELEAQNPRLAPGTLDCPDLDFHAGAEVRCLRTTDLGDGRVVKVKGTVTVTSLASGGRLHVAMDDRAEEFGLAGAQLAGDLRRQYGERLQVQPGKVRCPYLRGVVGAKAVCRVHAGGAWYDVDVVVTAVDPATYRTVYSWTTPHAATS